MYEREYKWRLTMKRMRIESEQLSQFVVAPNLLKEQFIICHNVFKWNILYDEVEIKIEVNMCMKGNTNVEWLWKEWE